LATKTQKVIKLAGLPTPHGKGLELVAQNKHAGQVQTKQRNINNMLKDELEFKGTKARETRAVAAEKETVKQRNKQKIKTLEEKLKQQNKQNKKLQRLIEQSRQGIKK
jgi:hypothetical protein